SQGVRPLQAGRPCSFSLVRGSIFDRRPSPWHVKLQEFHRLQGQREGWSECITWTRCAGYSGLGPADDRPEDRWPYAPVFPASGRVSYDRIYLDRTPSI